MMLAINTPLIEPGELWELKTVGEYGKPTNNSFCAITLYSDSLGKNGGQTNWTRGYQEDKDFVLSLQPTDEWTLEEKWQWATGASKTVYLYDDGVNPVPFKWPRIAIGSKGPMFRNRVHVIEKASSFWRVRGLTPEHYGYSLTWLYENGLVHRLNCEPVRNGYYSETPHGLMFMPVFDPNYYEHSKGETGLWLDKNAFYAKLP